MSFSGFDAHDGGIAVDTDSHAGHDHGYGFCGSPEGIVHEYVKLRIAAIFVIGVGSLFGTLFPILARRSSLISIPKSVFNFAKYFGSGVIIATAFIHLLPHGLHAFESECIGEAWHEYPYALALCMISIFAIFIIELVAFRWGTAKLSKVGTSHDTHGHGLNGHAAHGPETPSQTPPARKTVHEKGSDLESASATEVEHVPRTWGRDTATQIIGIAILEFGVLLHSFLIGLTLAVDPDFKVLFVVLVFHQTFEGLGLGSRLAYLDLGEKYNWVAYAGAFVYALSTPLGIAIGLGVRSSYNPGSATASLVTGFLDSFSAGVLVYTGLVELLAHEFLFNKKMMTSSNGKLAYSVGSMMLGAALMSLLGKWA